MPLETADKIEDLEESWPLGSDPKSQGDDHLRLIKRVLKLDALTEEDRDALQAAIDAVDAKADANTANKVDKAGDTMTGNLTVENASPEVRLDSPGNSGDPSRFIVSGDDTWIQAGFGATLRFSGFAGQNLSGPPQVRLGGVFRDLIDQTSGDGRYARLGFANVMDGSFTLDALNQAPLKFTRQGASDWQMGAANSNTLRFAQSAGVTVAEIGQAGTATYNDYTVITREKGDARYLRADVPIEPGYVHAYGAVAANGTIESGEGFTINKGSAGSYDVVFDNPIDDPTKYFMGGSLNEQNRRIFVIRSLTTTGCEVRTSTTGNAENLSFHFHVVRARP